MQWRKNENKYSTLVSADKNKKVLIKYIELWDKIKNLIKKINDKSGDYDEKYMKIKFNTDDNLPLNKILKTHNMTIVIRSVFQEDGKYWLYVLVMWSTHFRVNPHSIFAWMSRNPLLETGAISEF